MIGMNKVLNYGCGCNRDHVTFFIFTDNWEKMRLQYSFENYPNHNITVSIAAVDPNLKREHTE